MMKYFSLVKANKIQGNLIIPKTKGFWYNAIIRFKHNYIAMLSFVIILILTLLCIFVPIFSAYNYATTDFSNSLMAPNFAHLFGTDGLGRDLFVRTFIGGRITFEIAF